MLIVQISVEPKYFNRVDIAALTRKLNKDFRDEQQLMVAICDDYITARRHGIIFDLMTEGRSLGFRGVYGIDRVKGEEGISFSTERGKSISEIDIDFSKEPSSRTQSNNSFDTSGNSLDVIRGD